MSVERTPLGWVGRHRGRMLAAAIIVVAIAAEFAALLPHSAPLRSQGDKRFAFEDFSGGMAVGQTFRAPANDVSEARLLFASTGEADVVVRWWMLAWSGLQPDPWTPLYTSRMALTLPAGESWQRFTFPAVQRSIREVYQFRVQLVESRAREPRDAAPSVTLIASQDDVLRDGNIIAGAEQVVDKDLFMEVHFDDGRFATFHRAARVHLPEALQKAEIQVAILVLYNLVFAVFVVGVLADSSRRVE